MKKRLYTLLSIFGLALTSCNLTEDVINNNDNNETEEKGTNDNSNNDSSYTYTLNSTEASGIAPVVNIPTIDSSRVYCENKGELYEVNSDSTLNGIYSNGVSITASKGSTVTLTLDNATIYENDNSLNSLFTKNKNMNIIINLVDDSINYIYCSSEEQALKIKGDLTINGNGTLIIVSLNSTAIKANSININDAKLSLSSGNGYGIKCENLTATNANITVETATKDGIRAEVDDEYVAEDLTFDSNYGFVKLIDVTYNSTTYGDGIQANTYLYISGGNYDIKTQGTWVSYSNENILLYELETDDFKWMKSGNSYKKLSSDEVGNRYSNYYALSQSSKGLKVGAIKYTLESDKNTTNDGKEYEVITTDYNLTITNNANINITSSDSGAKVDYGDILIDGNSIININAGNKGLASDHYVNINGAETKLTISNSFEGIEANIITFDNGNDYISSRDDGINATTDYQSDSNYNKLDIIFNSGVVSINAYGDGIDSNGDIHLNGGIVLILCPNNSGNGPYDAGDNNKMYVNGGVLLALSKDGMLESNAISNESTQYSIVTTTSISANQTVEIINNNNTVLSVLVPCAINQIVYSSQALALNNTYTIMGSSSSSITITSKVSGSSNGGFNGNGPRNDNQEGIPERPFR